MKAVATILILFAVVAAVVPFFTDCQSQGRAVVTVAGTTVPMKCHWTGVAELGLAVPLVGVGGVLAFSRRRETHRALAIMGALLGALMILMPVSLIGVCPGDDMLCNMIMRPTLVFSGVLVIAASLYTLLRAWGPEPPEALG